MEGVYVKTEPEPIPHASTSEPPVPLAVPLEAQPCRLCANIPERAIEIYSTEGLSNQLSDRINEYLPVKVSPDDKLPLCCCWTCVTTLLSFHELVVACVEAEKRLQVVLTEPKPIPIPVPIPAVPDPEPEIPEYNDDDAEMMDADDGEGDDDYEPENDDEDEESEEETKPIPGTSDDTEVPSPEIKSAIGRKRRPRKQKLNVLRPVDDHSIYKVLVVSQTDDEVPITDECFVNNEYYQCPVCPTRFISNGLLQKHERTRHQSFRIRPVREVDCRVVSSGPGPRPSKPRGDDVLERVEDD